MSTAIPPEVRRRRSIVASLFFAPGCTATVRELRADLESVHNLTASSDLVRGDMTWLQEQGLVIWRDDTAQLTERGRDVARNSAPWPGQ